VVCCAPPGKEPEAEAASLVAACRGARRLVYVSSTGVYAPAHGDWVDERWPLEPITTSGRARVAVERIIATTPISSISLRVAGIYGPRRGLVERIRAGTYRIIGDGTSHVSRIHVIDLVEAIVRAGTSEITGAVNVADDDPSPIGEVADALATRLGLPLPPRVSPEAVDREVAGMLTANRKIANARMKRELGVVLRYPSWRDAITDDG
jgi:nucleoside-diphosphate-sugar epimerase